MKKSKRLFDLIFSLILLIVFSPVLVLAFILVWLFIGRPVIFVQPRPGYKGKVFNLYKFRTMKDLKDRDGRPLADHLRLTRFGRFLRKTSLDELPELFNVLKGEMSFVGPRPLLVEYLSLYTPEQARRHDVLPGITGLAQVSGRNNLDWESRFELDVHYVKNQSLLLDLKILFRTLLKVIAASDVEQKGQVTMAKFRGSSQAIRTSPLPPWPYFGEDEIAAATEVLKSGKVNYWTGQNVKNFEDEFARFHGVKHGIALANGTLALELALIGLGVGPGDEVITTCRTFIASASAIVRVGATPILADVDMDSQNITVQTIAPLITEKTKAIIVVHLAGWPCEMPEILKLANQHGIEVIEDCAQAHGARISGKLVGSFGKLSCFSFCQDKIMTTAGEGGMLLTDDDNLYEKLWAFKDHGKSLREVRRKDHPPGFRWLHESFGTNWRMTEIQGAIGSLQLKKLESWVDRRRAIASRLMENLSGIDALRMPLPPKNISHSYYKLYGFLRPEKLRSEWTRDRIMEAISAEGIPCFSGSCGEIYLEKAFKENGLGPKHRLPNAKQLAETSLMWLVHPTLDESYAEDASKAILKVMRLASKQGTE